MLNLIKMERYQLFRNRIYQISTLAVFVLGFLMADTYLIDSPGNPGSEPKTLTDIWNSMIYDSTFLLILLSCLLAFLLGQEFSCRTIDREITAGHSRSHIFAARLVVLLPAFNLPAFVYPDAGCLRELSRFGLPDGGIFLQTVLRTLVYSLLQNSAFFLLPLLCCFRLRDMAKSVAAAALVTFTLALYLGYGMMLGFPVRFLPTFQIREAVVLSDWFYPEGLMVALIWYAVLIPAAWGAFRRCELK